MHHVKQADSRPTVRPMPVDARDMRHHFRGSEKKNALLVVQAQKPLQYYATYALFFPMEAQSTRVVY